MLISNVESLSHRTVGMQQENTSRSTETLGCTYAGVFLNLQAPSRSVFIGYGYSVQCVSEFMGLFLNISLMLHTPHRSFGWFVLGMFNPVSGQM